MARPLGRRREASRQELTVVPLARGCRSVPGTFEGDVPQTQASRWRPGPHSRMPPVCVCVWGWITPNKGGGGAQVSGSPYLPGCFSSLASPEPGARASVCKQTGHVTAATRSPPLAPREPSGRPLGTATAPPHPSRAACSAGAGPSPERTARTGAESAPRPREPSSRSPNT